MMRLGIVKNSYKVGFVKREKICATPKAVLGFHSAWRPMGHGKRANSPVASQAMLDVYPAELRKWIARRGGLSSKMIFLHGHDSPRSCRPAVPQ